MGVKGLGGVQYERLERKVLEARVLKGWEQGKKSKKWERAMWEKADVRRKKVQ